MKLWMILRRLFMSKRDVLELCKDGEHVRGRWWHGSKLCPGDPPRVFTGYWCCCGYCGNGWIVRQSKPETMFGPDGRVVESLNERYGQA